MAKWDYLAPKEEMVEKHMGPGPHPSGSPQSVHGGAKYAKRGETLAGRKRVKRKASQKKPSGRLQEMATARGAKSAKYIEPPVSLKQKPTVHELMFKGIYAAWKYPMSLRKEDGLSVIMRGRDKKYYAYKRNYVFEVIPTEVQGNKVVAYVVSL